MPRLSCCFIFSPRSALLLARKHKPELLAEYVKVEKQIGHRFRKELSLAGVQGLCCTFSDVCAQGWYSNLWVKNRQVASNCA
jgi:hypothetical protein